MALTLFLLMTIMSWTSASPLNLVTTIIDNVSDSTNVLQEVVPQKSILSNEFLIIFINNGINITRDDMGLFDEIYVNTNAMSREDIITIIRESYNGNLIHPSSRDYDIADFAARVLQSVIPFDSNSNVGFNVTITNSGISLIVNDADNVSDLTDSVLQLINSQNSNSTNGAIFILTNAGLTITLVDVYDTITFDNLLALVQEAILKGSAEVSGDSSGEQNNFIQLIESSAEELTVTK